MVKVGDKIRILRDYASNAKVEKGDIFTVDRVFPCGDIRTGGKYHWYLEPEDFEVIPISPPKKIIQNGYEYSLVGPVKPEWLVDGAWVVSRITGKLYKVLQVSNCKFQAVNSDWTNNSGNLTSEEFSSAYRPHTVSDWKWGDWAMYGNERVFVIRVGSQGTCVITRRSSDTVFDYVPVSELTPTF